MNGEELLNIIAESLGRKVVELTDENFLNDNIVFCRIVEPKYLTETDKSKLKEKSFIGESKGGEVNMKKALVLEIWVDDSFGIDREIVEDVYDNAISHHFVSDGSVEVKIVKNIYQEENEREAL